MGPLSDRFGRRRPLVVSAAVCVVAGVVCAIAPNLAVLVVARLVQGFAGAGGMVIGRAVIADVVTGRAAAKAFTLMLTVGGVAPVLAPLVGGLLADPVGWRGMLWTVAGAVPAMLVGVVLVVPETHPAGAPEPRRDSSPRRPHRARAPGPTAGRVAVFALSLRRDDGLHLGLAVRLPERRRALRDRLRRRLRRQRRRADRPRAGWPAGWSTAGRRRAWCAPRSRCRSRRPWPSSCWPAGAPAWTYAGRRSSSPSPRNGAIMGNAAALAMAEVRAVAGTGQRGPRLLPVRARRGGLAAGRPRRRGLAPSSRPSVMASRVRALGFVVSRRGSGQPIGV